MLSRANGLTRLNALILRQLSTSLGLSKQALKDQKERVEETAAEVSKETGAATTMANRPKLDSPKRTNLEKLNIKKPVFKGREYNEKFKKGAPLSVSQKQKFSLPDELPKMTGFKTNPKFSKQYKEAILSIQTSLQSANFQSLIESCQKLISLFDSEITATEPFKTDPIRNKVMKTLLENLKTMTMDEFATVFQFVCRFNMDKYNELYPNIEKNLQNFKLGQLIKIVSSLRWLSTHGPDVNNTLRELTERLRNRIDTIDSIADAKRVFKLFHAEPSVIQRTDLRISQLSDKLTIDDWIDLFRAKSVLRQRNLSFLELCAYNIASHLSKTKSQLSVEQIQQCLLSCGILNYHDVSFFQLLLEQLRASLEQVVSSSGSSSTAAAAASWLDANEAHLQPIVASLGMLQLRDESLLNTLCSLLKTNSNRVKLIVSFVQTCGALNYAPNSNADFSQVISNVQAANFKLADARERVNFLNYVWSLCALNRADPYLITSVLEKKFLDSILNDRETKDFKANLLKILNINMHSIFRMDNYDGPNLPEDFNLAEYSEVLMPKKQSSANELLVSTLAGFRSINKFVKVNLLTPFGILIDAFMIVDRNGAPQPLEKYLDQSSPVELTENEKRVAIKLVGFKDHTLIKNKINGIVMFQLSLLRELGYYPLIVYQEELQSASLTNRVDLIQKRLKELVQSSK